MMFLTGSGLLSLSLLPGLSLPRQRPTYLLFCPVRNMHSTETTSHLSWFGTLLIVGATIGGLMALGSEVQELPGNFDQFIRANAAMWMLTCGAALVGGIQLLWRAGHRRTEWEPVLSGKRFHSVVVYSRPDCLLCEDAEEVLSLYRRWIPTPTVVNIDDDALLQAKFGESIPVVEIDGRIRFRGAINEFLFRRLIEASSPQAALRHR